MLALSMFVAPGKVDRFVATLGPRHAKLGASFLAGTVFARVIECAQSVGPMQRLLIRCASAY